MIIIIEIPWQALILTWSAYIASKWGNKFQWIFFIRRIFFGNEIIDHVAWKRYCAITKENVFGFRIIWTIYYSLSNDYRCNFSFIHHLLRLATDDVIFLSFKKDFHHNGSAIFGEMCRSASGCPDVKTQIFRHRSSDRDNIGLSFRLNRLNKHSMWDEWQDMVSLCSLIRFNWREPARVPLFSLVLSVLGATAWGC